MRLSWKQQRAALTTLCTMAIATMLLARTQSGPIGAHGYQGLAEVAETSDEHMLRGSGSSDARGAKSDEAAAPWLLVRSHDPTQSMCERIVEWADQVRGQVSGMTVSVDVTNVEPGLVASRLRDAGLPRWVQVQEWSDAELTEAYPVYKDEIVTIRKFKRTKRTLGWAFHAGAINLWYQRLSAPRPPAVWVFEDDVGYTGSLGDFLAAMRNVEADLLAHDEQPITSDFVWRDMASSAFFENIPLQRRFIVREHVERLSAALLDGLHDQALNHRVVAWSEVSIPSICRYLGLVSKQIDLDHISVPRYNWDVHLRRARWNDIMAKEDPEFQNKLYHALKF